MTCFLPLKFIIFIRLCLHFDTSVLSSLKLSVPFQSVLCSFKYVTYLLIYGKYKWFLNLSDSSHILSLHGSISAVLFLILLIYVVCLFVWIIWLTAPENLFVGCPQSLGCMFHLSKVVFICFSQDRNTINRGPSQTKL